MCQEVSGGVRRCQEVSGGVRVCQEVSGGVRRCQEVSGGVRMRDLTIFSLLKGSSVVVVVVVVSRGDPEPWRSNQSGFKIPQNYQTFIINPP